MITSSVKINPKQTLCTRAQVDELEKNKKLPEHLRMPVIKLFLPWTAATWLISEIDFETGMAFGLCDLGHGSPELGYVYLPEIMAIKGPFGLRLERDIHYKPDVVLQRAADAARSAGRIYA